MLATIGHNPSYVWRRILRARFIVCRGVRWSIGADGTIPILGEPWVLNGECIDTNIVVAQYVRHVTIENLIVPTEKRWNESDRLIWKAEKHGKYSPKIAYRLCVEELIDSSHLRRPGNCCYFSIEAIFALIETLPVEKKQLFSPTLWSLWKHQNLKGCEDLTKDVVVVVVRAHVMLTDWQLVNICIPTVRIASSLRVSLYSAEANSSIDPGVEL
ncbi:hypothetical protein MTR_1g035970 [Medicago truncatula]|uniref:Uncharacterized protein n=1 Tax=Medicago truncatula TaxID=3880 RepID=A0A072VFM8_MEDTR|nr:hypothetical protein MTR_1g035970 [Medicago truncatula]